MGYALFQYPLLTVAIMIAGLAGTARADALVLIAQVGGQYDYGIQLDPNHGLVVLAGDQITLSGLSGISGASVLPGLSFAYSTVITSPDAVTIVDTVPFVLDPLSVSHTISALRVISTASATGSVTWQVQTGSEGVLSGTVPGPVAPVPEPGGLPAAAAAVAASLVLKRSRKKAPRIGDRNSARIAASTSEKAE
jgi:hypothetical protein